MRQMRTLRCLLPSTLALTVPPPTLDRMGGAAEALGPDVSVGQDGRSFIGAKCTTLLPSQALRERHVHGRRNMGFDLVVDHDRSHVKVEANRR